MANEVYANNMEVSCKSADGKSVACFPDVCFTPPQAPPPPRRADSLPQSESAHRNMGLDVGPGKSEKLLLRADSGGNRTPDGFVPGGTYSAPSGV